MKPRPGVCEIASRLGARQASLRWLDDIERNADIYLELEPDRRGAAFLRQAKDKARRVRLAVDQGNALHAAVLALDALQAAWHAEIAEARTMINLGVKVHQITQGANDIRQQAAEREHAEWREQAEEIRHQNPALS